MVHPGSDWVGNLIVFASLILTAEFVRRLGRITSEIICIITNGHFNNSFALNEKSLPAKLQFYYETTITPWFDLRFVGMWIILLTVGLIREENNLSLKIVPPFLFFITAYIVAHDKLMLNASFIDNKLIDGTNHIGPGLAVAWFSFIENALLDKDKKDEESLKAYKEEQSIGSGRGISEAYRNGCFITDRPIILCPDLASYINNYEKYLEAESGKWCLALTNGIVKIDQMQRKRIGERDWLTTVSKNMYYPYEVSGTTRYCEFRVVLWKDARPSHKIAYKYFRVIDNRPLDSMRKWYHDQKGHGVSLGELKNQYELFVETLRNMLNKDERLRDKFYLLSFSGILSHELIAFEKLVETTEKMDLTTDP